MIKNENEVMYISPGTDLPTHWGKYIEEFRLDWNLEGFTQILLDFSTILDKNNIFHFPMFGTLLGMIRDDELIAHDKDIDFGYLQEDFPKVEKVIFEQLEPEGFKYIRNQFNDLLSVSKEVDGKEILIDFYFYQHVPQALQYRQGNRYPYVVLQHEMIPFKNITFKDKEFTCMAHPELFLERHYGKDWQTTKNTYV